MGYITTLLPVYGLQATGINKGRATAIAIAPAPPATLCQTRPHI